jgi:hypothetical protein
VTELPKEFGYGLPELIAADLDGTLLSHEGKATDRVKNAIKHIRSLGVPVLFITGRPQRWMHEVKEAFDYGDCIIAGGAMEYNLVSDEILSSKTISPDLQLEAIKRLRQQVPNIAFAIEWEDKFKRERIYTPRWDDGIDELGVDLIENSLGMPVYKILIRSLDNSRTPDSFLKEVRNSMGDMLQVTYCNLDDLLLEVSDKGVNKVNALITYCASKGFKREKVFAFGDNVNDFEMLSWAGQSWIMDGGHPEGKKFAKNIAPSFREDGFAVVIESILENYEL